MVTELALRCRCGKVRAKAVEVSAATTNHVVCYCRDCRAFLRWLDRADLLDSAGGSDVVHMARSRVTFVRGFDELRCVRLSARGMFRFYTACCKTPVGNTIQSWPFIGVIHGFFDPAEAAQRERAVRPLVRVQTRQATGPVPRGSAARLPMYPHIARLLLTWAMRRMGGAQLFDPRTGVLRVRARVLTEAERAALADAPRL